MQQSRRISITAFRRRVRIELRQSGDASPDDELLPEVGLELTGWLQMDSDQALEILSAAIALTEDEREAVQPAKTHSFRRNPVGVAV